MADPVRTCALSRTRHHRDDLVRLVASPDGDVVVDYRANLPGRGVWVVPRRDVLALLDRKRAVVERQLEARLDPDAVRAQLSDAVLRAVGDGLSLAAAAGALVVGQERLTRALGEERVGAVVVASDAAERTVRGLRAVDVDVPFVTVPWTSAQLGQRVGKSTLAAIGVSSDRAAGHLRTHLRRWRAIVGDADPGAPG